jgi:hypothetical protein
MSNQITTRSLCCNAKTKVVGKSDFYYICCKCGERCFVYFKERKIWSINPNTRVKPNIKKERREKDKIRQEIKEETNA